MVVEKSIFFILLVISTSIFSQKRYAVSFTDKNNSTFSLHKPQEFLSQKSIDRRSKQGIAITIEDIPVNQNYIVGVISLGATFCYASKWMNLVVVDVYSDDDLAAIRNLPYVANVRLIKPKNTALTNSKYQDKLTVKTVTDLDYGIATDQIKIMEGQYLHNLGFKGEGMTIAVLDAGFSNVNTVSAFSHLWSNNQILGYWDFENNNDSVFDKHSHGTMVLSTMAGMKAGELLGTAPKANYWLLRTEVAATETISEEYNWLAAAEFADSVGADIINSSLGYTTFDDSTQNHTYADLDGNTTVITNAADMAFSKGILVVNSAGNSGAKPWYYIGAPADGNDVLSVGAVSHNGTYASFSSHGPSFDGRVKPNVATVGAQSAVVDPNGDVILANGTSFSSPEMAGMAAAFWQAFPDKTNAEIKTAIEQSAHQYNSPDDELGYGIPNFRKAYQTLLGIEVGNTDQNKLLNVYPQPFNNHFNIRYYSAKKQTINIKVIDVLGKLVYSFDWHLQEQIITTINLKGMFNAPGIYSLILTDENGEQLVQKIIKQ